MMIPETRMAGRSTSSQQSGGSHEELQPSQDILAYAKDYARERPEVAALWCLGIGFILGWKLKPW